MVATLLSVIGIVALALLCIGLLLPNPDAARIDRINARRERERVKARERAARIATRRKGGES